MTRFEMFMTCASCGRAGTDASYCVLLEHCLELKACQGKMANANADRTETRKSGCSIQKLERHFRVAISTAAPRVMRDLRVRYFSTCYLVRGCCCCDIDKHKLHAVDNFNCQFQRQGGAY